jgi:FtsP/CotA-like multicopper oxidase with cupredoxin domain
VADFCSAPWPVFTPPLTGDWVFHCHIIEHQKTGMTSYVRVT